MQYGANLPNNTNIPRVITFVCEIFHNHALQLKTSGWNRGACLPTERLGVQTLMPAISLEQDAPKPPPCSRMTFIQKGLSHSSRPINDWMLKNGHKSPSLFAPLVPVALTG